MGEQHFWHRVSHWVRDEREHALYAGSISQRLSPQRTRQNEFAAILSTSENLRLLELLLTPVPSITRKGIEQGNPAFLAVVGREWIARVSAIVGPHEYTVLGVPLVLGAQDAFIENLETLEDWRGKGVASTLVSILFAYLHDQGITTVSMLIAPTNLPSQRVFEKCGCRRIALITSRRCCGRWTARFSLSYPDDDTPHP